MATSSEQLTECVICTEIFTDPQVLPCDHTFCKVCVNRLTQGGAVKCPNCNKVCRRDDVKPDFRLNTFIDALAKQAQEFKLTQAADVIRKDVTSPPTEQCEVCDENDVSFFCHQCQQWICIGCKRMHAKMTLSKDHTYTTPSEMSDNIHQRVKQEIQNLQAKTEQLKSATDQKAQTMTEIEAAQTHAKQTSQQLRAALHEDVDKYFDVIEERINTFCEQELKAVVDQTRDMDERMLRIDEIKTGLAEILQQDNSTVSTETVHLISKAQDLAKSVDDVTDGALSIPRVMLERNSDWKLEGAVNLQLQNSVEQRLYTVNEDNNVQLHQEANQKLKSQTTSEQMLLAAAQKQWVKQAEVKLPHNICSMHVINQQLWCCCYDAGIVVLNQGDIDEQLLQASRRSSVIQRQFAFAKRVINKQKYDTIPADRMGWVQDVARMKHGYVVIAATKGLFYAHANGVVQACIHAANCTSVAVHQDKVFAVMCTQPSSVCVYECHHDYKWVKVHSFSLTSKGLTTLSVKNNQIKCCSTDSNKITVYSLSGESLQMYETPASADAGKLHYPYICADDDDGSVLFTDCSNHRLQVMSEQGEFSVLQLQPPVSRPRCAVLFNNQLCVTSWAMMSNNTMHKKKISVYVT